MQISEAVAGIIPEGPGQPRVIYRFAGSDYLLVEYGDVVLDLNLRFRVHALELTLNEMQVEGILELAPGVRSVLIQYDNLKLPLAKLLHVLKMAESSLPPVETMVIPSRRIFLPIVCHDRWTREAVKRYMESVRAEGPYLPDNVEFIARCNGLSSIEETVDYFLATEHMVLGLGDVYLGAPCALPLDPRRRLVVPKYNPARTWTPEGTVGIGGAFVCIYPMESPGGYQLIGRTIPIWNTWQTNASFSEAPWLLRNFDRIVFNLVTEEEYEEIKKDLLNNRYQFKTEEGRFDIAQYNEFLQKINDEVIAFKKQQEDAVKIATVGY